MEIMLLSTSYRYKYQKKCQVERIKEENISWFLLMVSSVDGLTTGKFIFLEITKGKETMKRDESGFRTG